MDFEILANIVSTIGFPIVMTGVLFWYITKKDEQHREEMKELKDSLDRNSDILNELKGLISACMVKVSGGND